MSSNHRYSTSSIDRVYALALMELGQHAGTLDELVDEMAQLQKLLGGVSNLQNLLSSPALGKTRRSEIIDRVFRGRVSDLLYRFLQVLNQKGRLATLPSVARSFENLIDEKRGVVEVDAHVAQQLDQNQTDKIAQHIGAFLGSQVVLHQHVDHNLIGGLVLRIGDKLIDGSVATRLRSIQRQLVHAGQEQSRQTEALLEE